LAVSAGLKQSRIEEAWRLGLGEKRDGAIGEADPGSDLNSKCDHNLDPSFVTSHRKA